LDFNAIELLALRDVWFARQRRPGVSADFHVRRIFREYSQKFFTPLHEVYELPIDFVVTAWIEDIYEDFKDEDLLKEVQNLIKTEEQLLAERRREDESDADMWLLEKDIKQSEGAAKKLEDAVKALGDAASLFRQRAPTHEEKAVGARMSKPVSLVNTQVVPGESISISFEDVDLDSDSFGLLSDPKPQQS